MDTRLAEAARDRDRLRRRAFVAAWTQRLLLGGGALLVTALILGALAINRTWSRAFYSQCEPLADAPLEIPQIVDLKQRERAYQASTDDDAMLAVTAYETTALMRGETDASFELEIRGEKAIVHAIMPVEGGCYDVRYEGTAAIEDRTVIVTPDSLVVGEADLTWWVAGRTFRFDRDDLDGYIEPKALDALDNAERVELRDGQVWLRLYDPWKLW
jgi:hypothetical protein